MKFLIKILLIYTSILVGQSEEQIKKAKEIISRTGMSESQVRNAAKAQGYTDKQIDAAIQKEKSLSRKPKNRLIDTLEGSELPKLEKSNEIVQEEPKIDSKDHTSSIDDFDNPELKVGEVVKPSKTEIEFFGYDIFSRDPALFQATSFGAVDPDYLVGPGDDIIVMLWGETQFRQVLDVDREGFVFIPEIGQVFVNGLNLSLLESKLFRVFSQSYASLNPQGGTPTTFLDVSLGNLRPLRIQVLGEVAQPGAYTVSPSSTLFSSLYYFNGPTNLGSLRDIKLIRGGEEIATIDFYDYLLTGKKPKDKKLQLDDVVFIPRRLKTVTIEGEVNRNGIFELKPDESLIDLIALAGDLKITAYLERAQIDRIVPFNRRKDLGMDRMYTDVNLGSILKSGSTFPIQDGDHIKIFSVLDMRQNVVELSGAVSRPGNYDLGDSLKISELIKKADGVLGDAYLDRVDIIRTNSDFTEKLIKLNLRKALNNDIDNDILLKGLDRVKIYGTSEMIPKSYVSIQGHVKKPGRFPLQENMTLYDLIFSTGGFIDEEFKKRTYLDRADLLRMNDDRITRSIQSFNLGNLLNFPESENNILLKADDIIRVYKKDIFIHNKPLSITGLVSKPGNYSLKTGMTLQDLILEAGGLDANVYGYRVEIARINPLNDNLDEYAEIITFNIDKNYNISGIFREDEIFKMSSKDSLGGFLLKPYDLVSVRPDPFFTTQKKVSITGEIMYPGSYAILHSKEKITDIIKRAGGLLPIAYPEASQYYRKKTKINVSLGKILKNPSSKLNFSVQDGDEIMLLPRPNLITISGQVNRVGIHKFVSGKRVRYYLKLAGGLNPNADKNNIWVEYPNGDSRKFNRFSLLSPKVIDGSVINIGEQENKEPLDKTELAKELTAIFANLTQALAVVVLAAR